MAPFFRFLLLILLFSSFSMPLSADNVRIESKPIYTVEFTCGDFKQKAESCEPYACQTPFYRDPTIKMQWKIENPQESHCVISYTTYDLGLKDDNDNPMPITQTCEYDKTGIKILNEFIEDIEKGYYHPIVGNDNEHQGIYNCVFTSKGQPVKGTFLETTSQE